MSSLSFLLSLIVVQGSSRKKRSMSEIKFYYPKLENKMGSGQNERQLEFNT